MAAYGADAPEEASARIHLAVLKLANRDLVELARHIAVANQDPRDVIAAAEYPAAIRSWDRLDAASAVDRQRVFDADWEQYRAWLRAANDDGGRVMEEQPLTPEQEAAAESLGREFIQQLERVAVDMQTAFPQLREIAPSTERQLSEDEVEVSFTIDASGIVETLRCLPDGAGTDAFVAAYNARA